MPVIDTKKGNRRVVVGNFKLSEHKVVRKGTMYRCTKRLCKTYAIVDDSSNRVVKVSDRPHNHEPLTDQEAARYLIKCLAVQRALADQSTRRRHILRHEYDTHPDLAAKLTYGDYFLIRTAISSARRRQNQQTGQTGHVLTEKVEILVMNRIP